MSFSITQNKGKVEGVGFSDGTSAQGVLQKGAQKGESFAVKGSVPASGQPLWSQHVFEPMGAVLNRHSFGTKPIVVASSDYYPRATVVLPQTRFVPAEAKVVTVGNEQFEIPQWKDQWAVAKEQKLAELRRVMQYKESYGDCRKMIISKDGIECKYSWSDCLKTGGSCSQPAIARNPALVDLAISVDCPEKCVKDGPTQWSTRYLEKFRDLGNIRRDGDNLVFNILSGEQEIDFEEGDGSSDEVNAGKAAQLLVDIQHIEDAIRNDRQENPLEKPKQEALAGYKAAEKAYKALTPKQRLLQNLTRAIQNLGPEERESLLRQFQNQGGGSLGISIKAAP